MTPYSQHRNVAREGSSARRASEDFTESCGRRQQPAARRRGDAGRRTMALAGMRLAQLEDDLLGRLLDAHSRHDAALDRLLDDVRGAGELDAAEPTGPELDADAAAASARRIEATLVAAVIERHPRRDFALDRLLADLADVAGGDERACAPAAAHGAWADEDNLEEIRRAEFDMRFDNDFDGLG